MKLTDFVTFMQLHNLSNMIWLWHECPFYEKHLVGHGGDEDYVIIYRQDSMSSRVIDRLLVSDENSVLIENTSYLLGVTSHA